MSEKKIKIIQMKDENFEEEDVIKSEDDIMSEVDKLFEVSDEEIDSSLNALQNNDKGRKRAGRAKKPINIVADEIVTAFINDKSSANWTALQEFFWFGIKQYAFKFVKNNDDAYDMTIETFINAYNKIDTYDPTKSKFSTWLWTICRNNCLGFLKAKIRANIVDNDLSEIYDSALTNAAYAQDTRLFDNGEIVGGKISEIDVDDFMKELCAIAIKEIDNIGGVTAQILKMRFVNNMKIREIADSLGMKESNVKNHLYKGVANLLRILKINHADMVDTYYDIQGESTLDLMSM